MNVSPEPDVEALVVPRCLQMPEAALEKERDMFKSDVEHLRRGPLKLAYCLLNQAQCCFWRQLLPPRSSLRERRNAESSRILRLRCLAEVFHD